MLHNEMQVCQQGSSPGVSVKEGAAYEVVHNKQLSPCQLTLLKRSPPAQSETGLAQRFSPHSLFSLLYDTVLKV